MLKLAFTSIRRLLHVLTLQDTNVPEDSAASIFRVSNFKRTTDESCVAGC